MFSPASKPENKPQVSESSENHLRIPSISLPKGNSAIHGVGENANTNPTTSVTSQRIPVYTGLGHFSSSTQLSLSDMHTLNSETATQHTTCPSQFIEMNWLMVRGYDHV